MTTIDKSTNLIPFLFMGCWNRNDKPRSSVADALRENPIKTLILGGDNIYPNKVRIGNNVKKVYNLKTLMNGIDMLYGKDIYTALGNHNVDGSTLNVQLSLNKWIIPSRYYSVNFADHSLIVIDSNLITTDKYNIMKEWLMTTINYLKDKGRKYYYVQHDPFISFKKSKKTVLANISEMLNILAHYPPIMILCADTHNYQKGTLKVGDVSITQYIVGTGGASPDPVTVEIGTSETVDDITYKMTDYIPGYGYLEVSDETKFIKVLEWSGGKRRRTHKKRRNNYRGTKRV